MQHGKSFYERHHYVPSSSNAEQTGIEGEEWWVGIQELIVEDIRKEMIFFGETVLIFDSSVRLEESAWWCPIGLNRAEGMCSWCPYQAPGW